MIRRLPRSTSASRETSRHSIRLRSSALIAIAGALSLGAAGCSSLSVSSDPSTVPSAVESSAQSTTPKATRTSEPSPSATSSSPTFRPTPRPTASPTKTKVKASPPLFVASLPSTVTAVVGQRIIVQFPSDAEDGWTASAGSGVSVGSVSFKAPPEEQPDAPGTTIANLTAQALGTTTVNFTSGKGQSTKLVVKVK